MLRRAKSVKLMRAVRSCAVENGYNKHMPPRRSTQFSMLAANCFAQAYVPEVPESFWVTSP